ncbi:hypothetical protein PIB30_009336, partial [Stylosanthes scabra]|nr:hypothetical protein [Stylosanthes scabra]
MSFSLLHSSSSHTLFIKRHDREGRKLLPSLSLPPPFLRKPSQGKTVADWRRPCDWWHGGARIRHHPFDAATIDVADFREHGTGPLSFEICNQGFRRDLQIRDYSSDYSCLFSSLSAAITEYIGFMAIGTQQKAMFTN